MKQTVMNAPFTISLCEAPTPVIAADEVLVRITHVGICGSDMQMYHGKHKYAKLPTVIGHEACGIVEAVGETVKGFVPGDKVAVQPQLVCGTCYPCQIGRENVCESLQVRGVHADGFASTFAAIKASMLHLCPADMPLEFAVMAEPVAVAVGAIRRGVYAGANIAVIGAGIIGNLIAQVGEHMSGRPVLIADIQEQRLELARQCGITHTANLTETSLKEAIADVFGTRKADIIIDAAAVRASFHDAIGASRPASQIIITGNYKEEMSLEVPLLQRREVDLIGHMMYTPADFALAIDYLASAVVKVEALIAKRYPLDEMAEAFLYVDQNPADSMKVIIEI